MVSTCYCKINLTATTIVVDVVPRQLTSRENISKTVKFVCAYQSSLIFRLQRYNLNPFDAILTETWRASIICRMILLLKKLELPAAKKGKNFSFQKYNKHGGTVALRTATVWELYLRNFAPTFVRYKNSERATQWCEQIFLGPNPQRVGHR